MNPEETCVQLLQATEVAERERMLSLAAASPDCLAFAMGQVRRLLAGEPAEALRFAELATEIAERGGAPTEAAASWRVRGQALRAQGRHGEAVAAFEAAAAHATRGGEARLAAQVQIGSVDSLGMLGRYDEAIALAQRLEATLRAENAEEEAAKVLFNAGSLHFRRDRYAAALDCYERAGEIFARQGEEAILARVNSNRANALQRMNRIEEAIALYEQARAVFQAEEMPLDAALVDSNLGFLHYVSGRHAVALAALTRAQREFAERGREQEAASCDIDIAETYRALNLYPEALQSSERALRTYARLPTDYDRARAEVGRAAALTALERREEALTALEHADAIFRGHRNPLQRAHVRLNRAYLLRAEGREAEACSEAERAAATFARHRLAGWAAEARFLRADVALEAGENATRRMQAISRTARRQLRGWLECRAERALGRFHMRQAQPRRALRHLRAGVAVLEDARTLISPEEMHVAFLRDKQAIYEDLVRLLLERGQEADIAEALEYVERSKSRLLWERVQSALEVRSASPETAQMRERLASLRAELSRGYHQAHTFGENDPRRLAGSAIPEADALIPLEEAYRAALREQELAALHAAPTPLRLTSVATSEALRAALATDQTLVEFYTVGEELCAFVVSAKGVRIRPHLSDLPEIEHAARRLRYHLQKTGMAAEYLRLLQKPFLAGIEEALRALYDLLLRPLEDLIGTERVILIPHGALHGLPFHAFLNGQQYALDRWEFLYAPSATIWLSGRAERPAAAESALLMGVPGPGIERVTEEVERLAQFLPESKLFCAETATLATFFAHAEESCLLHLATHALFREDNPLFSGLQFADGWLLARDLYDRNLHCDLATLSACHTGVAHVEAGDELFGLIRGFLVAGAQAVAASLWPADDNATTLLMEIFYSHLAGGMPKAAALRAAQRELRAQYPHPYYWAAFTLVGKQEQVHAR